MGSRFALSRACACSLVLLLVLPVTALADSEPPGTVVEAGQSDALEAALKRHGWHVERDSEGGILLFLPPPEPVDATTDFLPVETREKIEPPGDRVEARDLDGLQRALEAQGWRVQRSADGDLLVFPVDPAVGESVSPMAPALDPEPGPSEAVDEPSTPSSTQEIRTASEMIDATDLDVLQAAAAERGWMHQREADGSLVLLPPGRLPKPGDAGPCQIGMVRVSGAEEVPLPVDTEAKAYRLAEFWLHEMDVSSLAIGRIRLVNRLFLVSLVEHEEPFLLDTQLVVRVDDGCLIAIPR